MAEATESLSEKAIITMEFILSLIGNVDHSTGNGENSARMRGELLNDIRAIIKAELRRQPEPESVEQDIETLDKHGTIKAIEALQREMMKRAEPYQKRLAAFLASEPPVPVITDH